MTTEILTVPLGDRAYDIHIGGKLLENAGTILAPHLKRPRVVIVTDENVIEAQGDRLKAGLAANKTEANFIVLNPGEETKSWAQLEHLTGALIDHGVERNDLILAFGGGVVGDITGFAASILRRGCRFAQIPTTLLAQVDSAVGGKTAINTPQGKNLIGAFHQPVCVIADIDALSTLPERELHAGYAEVVKYGLINDKAFFDWLEKNGPALLSGDAIARSHAVRTSCASKAAIVAADEREENARALLNLGHTFGHAFEAAFGYSDKLLHGEAVALGMCLAFEFSVREGLCKQEDADRVKTHVKASKLPTAISDLPGHALKAEVLLGHMKHDKKVKDGAITLVLAKGIGAATIVENASASSIEDFLKERLAS